MNLLLKLRISSLFHRLLRCTVYPKVITAGIPAYVSSFAQNFAVQIGKRSQYCHVKPLQITDVYELTIAEYRDCPFVGRSHKSNHVSLICNAQTGLAYKQCKKEKCRQAVLDTVGSWKHFGTN